MVIDPTIIAAILGIFGIGVVGFTEMVKKLFNLAGVGAYIASAVISAAATAFVLASAHVFAIVPFLLYTLMVFLEANGIYKALKTG
jgi:hypothetical protein